MTKKQQRIDAKMSANANAAAVLTTFMPTVIKCLKESPKVAAGVPREMIVHEFQMIIARLINNSRPPHLRFSSLATDHLPRTRGKDARSPSTPR